MKASFQETLPAFQYLICPLLAGLGVAVVAGPLGVLMVWRRLAYFGDTLSHSGLLGVTLSFVWHIELTLSVCLVAILVALLLFSLKKKPIFAADTLLGFLSHTTLALGLLVLAMVETIRVDVLGFLYGDILAVQAYDVLLIYVGGGGVLGVLFFLWSPLLRITVHQELASVEGVPVQKVEALYLLLLAIVVAIAIKIVGVLLITALLIIPGAAARILSNSPEKMAFFASLLGCGAVLCGIFFSYQWDLPTGPSIVAVAALCFVLLYGMRTIWDRSV